jgi:ketosteroid isomerase-like protein
MLNVMDAVERAVLSANEAFYEAFRGRSVVGMQRLWAQRAPVACMHPGMPVIVGRDEVLRSWQGILGHPQAPILQCSNARAHVLGTSAFVTCLEASENDPPRLIATNVFVLEDGHWRIVHHHAAPISPATPVRRPSTPPPKRSDLN